MTGNFEERLIDNEGGYRSMPSESHYNKLFTFFIFIIPALGGLLFGYDIGGTAGATASMEKYLGTDVKSDQNTTYNSMIVSFSLVGATLGSIMVFPVGDRLGRRRVLGVAGVCYIGGAVIMLFAKSIAVVIVARTVYGIGIGFCMHSAPIYIAELSPPKVRGFLISMKEAFIVIGILLGYLAGTIFKRVISGDTSQWRWVYGASLAFSVPFLFSLYFLPPSPRWLVLRSITTGQTDLSNQARQVMRRARPNVSDHVLDEEVLEITDTIQQAMGSSWGELLDQKRALIIGTGLVFFQQVTGQPSVLYFAPKIFEYAGFTATGTVISVGIGCFKLFMTGIAVFTVDKYGRRPLLTYGTIGLGVALVILGFALFFKVDRGNDLGGAVGPLAIGSLVIYVGGYQMGFGPISWLMISEVFPLRVRTRAFAISTIVNFGTNAIVSFTFLPLRTAIGPGYLFWGYAAIAVIAVIFIRAVVPETKNKTLEQISAMLDPTQKNFAPLQEYETQ